MGDRVLIVATDGAEISPAIYGHWFGYDAPQILAEAGERGIVRKGDVSYAAARICGHFHEKSVSTTGLGILPAPDDLEDETLTKFSHGDAGVIILNVEDGTLRYVGGYLARREEGEDPLPASVKLAA